MIISSVSQLCTGNGTGAGAAQIYNPSLSQHAPFMASPPYLVCCDDRKSLLP